jgi:hypothetical protein
MSKKFGFEKEDDELLAKQVLNSTFGINSTKDRHVANFLYRGSQAD